MKIILIILFFIISCNNQIDKSDVYLIPEKFEGTIFIIYEHENGQEKIIENNKRIFKVPNNGILKTKFKKTNKTHTFPEFYTYDKLGKKTKIKFVLPGSFDKSKFNKDEKLVFSFENGLDKKYHFSIIVCGKPSNKNIGKDRYQLFNKVFNKYR